MKVFLPALGTRGDVQPFVALAVALRRAGHDPTVCTSASFAPFIEEHGVRCAPLDNALVELTSGEAGRKAIEDFGGGVLGRARWIREAARRFKPIFRKLLAEEWEAAQGTDLVVFHPSAVGGVHIAEALRVPGVFADPMPTWVPTGEFPAFTFPDLGLGASYNRLTYRLLPLLMRGMYGSVVTRWRRETLGLPGRPSLRGDLERGDGVPVPVLQAYSRHVVPRPADWPANVTQTGYWFLEEGRGWEPPRELTDFLAAGPPPVFVGFGSMARSDPARTGALVREALSLAGTRGVIVTGWGGVRIDEPDESLFVTDSVPYDWLLPRVSAVVHHGGAGTTASGLRAGRPTVICPFVADQPFWGARVAALGAGPRPIPQRRLTAGKLAAAIRTALTDGGMRERAADLGARIRAEDGLAIAVERLERVLESRPATLGV